MFMVAHQSRGSQPDYPWLCHHQDMYSEVLVGLDQMGRVESMEWRWFGTPLMTAVPVRLARAINGWASFQITPHIVRTHSSS